MERIFDSVNMFSVSGVISSLIGDRDVAGTGTQAPYNLVCKVNIEVCSITCTADHLVKVFVCPFFILKIVDSSSPMFSSMMLVHVIPVVSLNIASPTNCL